MSTQNRRSSFSSSTSSSLAKRQHASSSENLGKVKAEAKKRAPLTNLTNLNNFPPHGSRSLGPSSTMNRRSSFSSSTSLSPAKRQHASSSENIGKVTAVAKKRVPLTNLNNLKNFPSHGSRSLGPSSTMVPCSTKIGKSKKGSPIPTGGTSFSKNALPLSSNMKTSSVGAFRDTPLLRSHEIAPSFRAVSASCSMDVSPSKSDGNTVSMDETMSTCDSFKSPEYVDNNGPSEIDSVDRKTFGTLNLSDHTKTADDICGRETLAEMETDDKIVNVDYNYTDPQLCATIACDIYKHLRATEVNKRPSTNFMERIQTDINANMRSILVDWLVEVAEEYRLVPDTLYLTVNYIDRYLSGNAMNRQRLQLLGVACMMIAAKYEEICAPQVEEFCYITDNTYFKDEVLQMESSVLNYLKFELTAATAKCFLRRFVRAAQGVSEDPSMLLECLANYFTELSLLEYNMLCYQPSLIAASAIFLANFVLNSSRRPWNSTLRHYTLYQPSDLRDCVKDLHHLCCNNYDSTLPAIREKYSQHKYKCVATKACPPLIPPEFFHDLSH